MDVVIYQSLIIYVFVMFYGVFTTEVHMANVSKFLATDGVELRCAYNIDHGVDLIGVNFYAMNYSTDTFIDIAVSTILQSTPPQILPYGKHLFGNANITEINNSASEVVLTFNDLKCKHERSYKCSIKLYDEEIDSLPAAILVKVHPLKPEKVEIFSTYVTVSTTSADVSTSTLVDDERDNATITASPRNAFIKETTVLNLNSSFVDKNITSTSNVDYNNTVSTEPTTVEPSTMEGDYITFQCSGNVGKPAGMFSFKKTRKDNILSTTYNATSTETVEIPGNCSYYRTSYLTFQVTAEDNQAVIRCAVVSPLADATMFVDSKPLKVQYRVREPSITKHPDKKDYIVGTDISITLTCKSDGNPIPMYHWFKDGSDEQISTNETYTIMDINTTYSGIYTCNVSNIINDLIQTESEQVKVNIINEHDEADTSTSSSSTTGSSSGTDEISGNLNKNIIYVIIGVLGVLLFVVLLSVGCFLHKRNKKGGKDEYPENNGSTNNLMHSNSKYMGGSRPDAYDSVHLEGDSPVIVSGKKEQNVEDVRKHNEEYLKKQTNEEKNENKSPTSDQPVIYAEVNKATKSKNRQETSNQQDDDDDTYEGSQEGIYDQSGNNRHKENKNAEQFDKIGDVKEQNSTDDAESSVKSNQKGSYVNQALSKGEKQVATVPPISRSSAGSQDYEQTSELTQKGYENVKGTDNTHTSTGQSINQTSF